MNQRSILYVIAGVIGIPALITIGVWSATDPVLAAVSALIVFGLVVVTQLGRNVWLLIPFAWSFAGALRVVPGQFAPRDIAVGVVVLVLVTIWTVRRFPIRFRVGSIEIGLLLLLLMLGQAYLRNPTGLSIFGSESIGGRSYFEVAVATVSFVVVSAMVVNFRSARGLVFAYFAGAMCAAAYDSLLGLIPAAAIYGASVYHSSGATSAIQAYLGVAADPTQGTGRLVYLKKFATPITGLVMAFRSPLELLKLRNVGFLLLLVFAGLTILLTGFRSSVAEVGLFVLAATMLHRKYFQLLVMFLIGAPLVAGLLLLQGSVIDLPLPAQRALSFLPADWSPRAIREAQGSSDWRFKMWEEALTSDRYIRNKMLGDGFGFTAREMAYQKELMVKGRSSTDLQDYYLTIGAYHSGPIETIKRVGYLGLGLLIVVMFVLFKAAVNLVNRTRGTPYYPYAVFCALPLVIHPFYFILIFGTLKGSLTVLMLFGSGVRLLDNSFLAWRRQKATVTQRQAAAQESLPLGGLGAGRPA